MMKYFNHGFFIGALLYSSICVYHLMFHRDSIECTINQEYPLQDKWQHKEEVNYGYITNFEIKKKASIEKTEDYALFINGRRLPSLRCTLTGRALQCNDSRLISIRKNDILIVRKID